MYARNRVDLFMNNFPKKSKNKCSIIVPIYKRKPDTEDVISLKQLNAVLGKYPIYYVAPQGLDTKLYQALIHNAKVKFFSPSFFEGFDGYNRLMMSESFYQSFEDYEKILICQTDAFVFSDQLSFFMDMPYDYIGSPIAKYKPWSPKLVVGNGGFSLRTVKAHLEMIRLKKGQNFDGNEDSFFSQCGEKYPEKFSVAPLNIALSFSFDQSVANILFKLNNNNLPFAFHAWNKGDNILAKQMITPFLQMEYKWPIREKKEILIQTLISFLKEKNKVYFYGAGDVGRMMYDFCEKQDIDFEGFLVSDDQQLSKRRLRLKNIFHLNEIELNDNIAVVITISRSYRNSCTIEKKLHEKGVKDIYNISQSVLWALEENLIQGVMDGDC